MLPQDTHTPLAELSHTSTSHGPKQHLLLPQQPTDSAEEFKFTLAAARRTELRRLRNFVKMADYMMCDTLQQVHHAADTTPAPPAPICPSTHIHTICVELLCLCTPRSATPLSCVTLHIRPNQGLQIRPCSTCSTRLEVVWSQCCLSLQACSEL